MLYLAAKNLECIVDSMPTQKSPSWVRAVQIGLGALTIVLSIFALAFPGATFISIV